MSRTTLVTSQRRRAQEWCKWVLEVAASWTEDIAPSGPLPPTQPRQTSNPPVVSTSQEIWRTPGYARCRLCGAHGSWAPEASPPVALRRTCKGTMGSRAGIATDPGSRPAAELADDGFLSRAFLRNKGANMARAQPIDVGDAGQVPPPTAQRGAMDERPTSTPRGEFSEEEPFDLQLTGLGHDDSETVAIGAPALVQQQPAEVLSDTAVPVRRQSSAHVSHALQKTANVVWCSVCGRFAAGRLGSAEGVYPSRLRRLRQRQMTVAPV